LPLFSLGDLHERFFLEMSDEDWRALKVATFKADSDTGLIKTGDAVIDRWEEEAQEATRDSEWAQMVRERFNG